MDASPLHLMYATIARKLRSISIAGKALLTFEPVHVIRAAIRGHTAPLPPEAKRAILARYSKRFHTRTFVETGTYLGETIDYLRPLHDRLITIELSFTLFSRARRKFAKDPRITCLQGNSIDHLPSLLSVLPKPALIWLDAHYSGGETALGDEETPIIKELALIFSLQRCRHIILIDDAREFGSNPAYPGLDIVQDMARANGYAYENRFDILRLLPSVMSRK